MRRDLHVSELFCYRGRQELVRTQAPQLEAVSRQIRALYGLTTLLAISMHRGSPIISL